MTPDRSIKLQVRLDSTPQKAFAALTDSQALQAWFAEHAAVDLAASTYNFWGRYSLGTPSKEEGQHQILDLEQDKRLKFRWHFEDMNTEVTYELHERGQHTILTLQHDMFFGENVSEGAGNYEDFWFLSLENFRRYLDGKAVNMRCDFSLPMKGNIDVSIDIDADAETVFDVLINPAQMERWIARKAEVDPRVGGKYRLGWGESDIDKIEEYEENAKISQSWQADEYYPASTTTWTLEKSSGKTRLTLFHSGFADDADTDGLHLGWRNFINWIGSIAEYGEGWQSPLMPLDPEKASIYPKAMMAAQDEVIIR